MKHRCSIDGCPFPGWIYFFYVDLEELGIEGGFHYRECIFHYGPAFLLWEYLVLAPFRIAKDMIACIDG